MNNVHFQPKQEDLHFASNVEVLHWFFNRCKNSENVVLRLSTCRNAYLTINQLFVDIQILIGNASFTSGIRGGCELLCQREDASKVKKAFNRAKQTIGEYNKKKAVWENRKEIQEEIDGVLDGLRKDKHKQRVVDQLQLIFNTIGPQDPEYKGGWFDELMRVDQNDSPHLSQYFSVLDKIFKILECCVQIGSRTADVLDLPSPVPLVKQRSLFSDETVKVRSDNAQTLVKEYAEKLAELCGWTSNNETVNIASNYVRPNTFPPLTEVALPVSDDHTAVELTMEGLGAMIRESLYFSHDTLCNVFKPNVGTNPMPYPFVIDLPPPDQLSLPGKNLPVIVERIRCTLTAEINDVVSIAVAALNIPGASLKGKEYHLETSMVGAVTVDIRKAIARAHRENCKAIVFPEYSVPQMMRDEIFKLSNQNNLVIIAGFDGQIINQKACDQCIIAIPGEREAHFQYKREPSPYESTPEAFYCDNKLKLFSNSPIGDFSVVLCSDIYQLSTLQAWGEKGTLPDILFLVARNPYPELYKNLATAYSMMLYTHIVIANVYDGAQTTSEGSCVVSPKSKDPLSYGKIIDIEGSYLKSILIHEIDLGAIRCRSRGKPSPGYLSIPHCARRI